MNCQRCESKRVADISGKCSDLPPDTDSHIVAAPQKGNTWTCFMCGTEAIVGDD